MRTRSVVSSYARCVPAALTCSPWTRQGCAGCNDSEHLNYATAQGRVLYSFNMGDFDALHAAYLSEGKSHTGIILAPQQRYGIGEQMRRLLRLIHTISAEEMRDRLEFLSAWG